MPTGPTDVEGVASAASRTPGCVRELPRLNVCERPPDGDAVDSMEAEGQLWGDPANDFPMTGVAEDVVVDLTVLEPVDQLVEVGALEGPQSSRLHTIGWRTVKRAFDLIGSLLLIAVCLPVMVLTAAAIWAETRSGVLFVHKRVRGDRGEFGLLKFRTMVPNALAVLER